MAKPHFIYPLIKEGTFGLCSLWSYYHYIAMNIHVQGFCVCVILVFISLEFMPTSGTAGSYGNSVFSISRNFQTVFQSSSAIQVSSAMYRGSNFSTFTAKLTVCLLGFSHPSGYEVVSTCGFDLHFPAGS